MEGTGAGGGGAGGGLPLITAQAGERRRCSVREGKGGIQEDSGQELARVLLYCF